MGYTDSPSFEDYGFDHGDPFASTGPTDRDHLMRLWALFQESRCSRIDTDVDAVAEVQNAREQI